MNFRSLTAVFAATLLTILLPVQLFADEHELQISFGGFAEFAAAAIDSDGSTHIVWSNDFELYYKMLDSSGDTLIDETFLGNTSRQARIVVGDNDKLYIVAHDDKTVTFYLVNPSLADQDGTASDLFTIVEVDTDITDYGKHAALVLDAAGNVHIGYSDLLDDGIGYAKLDADGDELIAETFVFDADAGEDKYDVGIAVDEAGNVHLTWVDTVSTIEEELYYGMLDGSDASVLIDGTLLTPDDDFTDRFTSVFAHDGLISIVWSKRSIELNLANVGEVFFIQLDPSLNMEAEGDPAIADDIITIDEKQVSLADGVRSWYARAGMSSNGLIDVTANDGGYYGCGSDIGGECVSGLIYFQIDMSGNVTRSQQQINTRSIGQYDSYQYFPSIAGNHAFLTQFDDEEVLQVYRVSLNEAPTDIALSDHHIDDNTDTSGGWIVGALSGTDPDLPGDTLSFAVTGGADAGVFSVVGDDLVITDGILDFESQASYEVIVTVTDAGGLTYQETFTIGVNNTGDTIIVEEITIVEDDDNFFGCSLGSNDKNDPTFPLLVVLSLVYMTRRKWMRAQ